MLSMLIVIIHFTRTTTNIYLPCRNGTVITKIVIIMITITIK